MIKHHPSQALLASFCKGDLPSSLSAAIAIHADMCPVCQSEIAALEEQQASLSFEQAHLHDFIVEDSKQAVEVADIDFESMINNITNDEQLLPTKSRAEKYISIDNEKYNLPRALENMPLGQFSHIGKLSRARFQLDEDQIHTSLLHIKAGGSVPEHTHKGYELTLLLSGHFHDEHGVYEPGDFIMLDSSNTHKPTSEQGCLCFTVANDSLHFTQGINKLLNPIGAFIY